ncbi:MAG: DNA alkylation repair protein [Flavobacteriales bacterium]|nr:DNA alkylation repair protein [Flavobacteriales bacterium]
MAQPLKDLYNVGFIDNLADAIEPRYSKFDRIQFIETVFENGWEDKELKERMRHISESLGQALPPNYKDALAILMKICGGFDGGFEYMIFPDFVEVFGQDSWSLSMVALHEFTKYSSSEFAIRPFLQKDPKRGMQQMLDWSLDPNYHVRRLASEGCRPRLPWAMSLARLKEDPSPIIPILENLVSDPELYVRRSVANNLNDISKDHPEFALSIAYQWHGKNDETDRLVKHAMRGLLKAGHPKALRLFDFEDPAGMEIKELELGADHIQLGDKLDFSFVLSTPKPAKVRLEYAIHYVKANGSKSPKVFQIAEKRLKAGDHPFHRKQLFKDLSTRKHYAGGHEIDIRVNGVVMAREIFELVNA